MDTIICNNCRSNIPKQSWFIHELSCKRHKWFCEKCQESYSKDCYETHEQEYHATELCECGEEIDQDSMEYHSQHQCTERMLTCVYCNYPVKFIDIINHETDCGSRTELCEHCKQRIQLRYISQHNCQSTVINEPVTGDELVICPFCLAPSQNYILLQNHIFETHSSEIS